MKTTQDRSAFTLIEVLIVVVIMAILAATIIPQFTDSTKDAKTSTAKMNLATLRAQIQLYRTQHTGARTVTAPEWRRIWQAYHARRAASV